MDGGEIGARGLRYVIQKHWASHLHYDFRLELDGTMKSWAVPKGPSFDCKDKRLAVHVEDHPISYSDFEGTIPAKQYGAGKVLIWDSGTWHPIGDAHKGYRDGDLKFELRGHKLHGGTRNHKTKLHWQSASGRQVWSRVTLASVVDTLERPVRFIVQVEDITDRDLL